MAQRSGVRGDRLTPLDVSNLRVEARGLPMHVAALVLLDGTPLLDASGRLRLEEIRSHVAERSRSAARLRQVLVWPGGRGAPVWRDDPAFDISRHLRARAVPDPGDEPALLALCAELNRPALDRSRPLWEMWLLDGLADGRVGLLVRLHHVLVDGIAALEMLGSMLDLAPDPPSGGPAAAAPRPPSTGPGPAPPRPLPARARSAVAGGARQVAVRAEQAGALARLGRAPALSWNRPVGGRRTVMLLRADLDAVRDVAHAHAGKVNDVVLAAVVGGARRLLESRGELAPDLVLHVAVPTSIRRPGESGGNRVGIKIVPLPVGRPDAVARLDEVVAATTPQRGREPYQPAGRLLQRWMVHVMHHQRLINLVVSNVAGPPVPVYFAGARVHEMFQLSVLQGNLGIGVGLLSYDGRLHLDIAADADVVPDVAVFTAGVAEALDQLGAAAVPR